MTFRFLFLATIALIPTACFAISSSDLDKEYGQVRSIALRDPKVKAAFESANQRLEAKIVEIDPALKGYVIGHPRTTPAKTAAPLIAKRFVPPSKLKAAPAHATTHVIATGDTLSSIASHYKISVAALQAANPTVNEKKLQVTEKLTIPAPH